MVSAIMITGKTPKHERMARLAVQAFIDQSYENRELVVINDGEYELKVGHPMVREVPVGKGRTLGELRNIGMLNAKGEWVIQWDDDDHHHPHRILYQMAHRRLGCAVLLRKQIRVDVLNGEAICIEDKNGIAGTILHPHEPLRKYPDIERAEDKEFLKLFGSDKVLLDNNSDSWPGPALYVRFYHGKNTWSRENIMGGKGSYSRRWNPNSEERAYIAHVLETYGLKIAW